ncbi:MAG: lactate utilization protein [Clostridia bacterium]|nr:lactate utilization protein [Clostridia bacterium]
MDAIAKWHAECKAQEIVEILKKKDFNAIYAQNSEAAKKIVMDMIPEGASIAVGGSVTLSETGIMSEITSGKYKFIDRFNTPSFEDMLEKYREGFFADYFVTGTNAITKTGELVNTDCTGNRTGAIAFGPKRVIVVAGVNKIVDTVEDGIKRAKSIAPMNAKRITHKTPCTIDGKCHECHDTQTICNITNIIHNCYKFPGRITVVIIPEILGY